MVSGSQNLLTHIDQDSLLGEYGGGSMAMPSSPPEVSASLPPSALKRGAAKGNQGRAVHFAVQGPGPGEIPTRQMAYVCSTQCSTQCSLPLSSVASLLSLLCSTQCSTQCSLPLSSVASPLSLFCSLRHSLHVLYSSFNTLSCPLNMLTWASESTTIITNMTTFLLLNNDALLSTGTCPPSVSLSLLAAHLCQRRCR
jgi:hypothetical protein